MNKTIPSIDNLQILSGLEYMKMCTERFKRSRGPAHPPDTTSNLATSHKRFADVRDLTVSATCLVDLPRHTRT